MTPAQKSEFRAKKGEYKAELSHRDLDSGSSFHQLGSKLKRPWNDLAMECLSLAEKTFGVSFTRCCFDGREHGDDIYPVPPDRMAEFYFGPSAIIELARRKLLGQLQDHDGRAYLDDRNRSHD